MTQTGTVQFTITNAGSKSESLQPFLVSQEGTEIPPQQIHCAGDNPFMNQTLRQYENKLVELSGNLDEKSNIFIVDSVTEITGDEKEAE